MAQEPDDSNVPDSPLSNAIKVHRYLFGHAPGTAGLQGRGHDAELLVLIQAAIRAGVPFDSEAPARAWGLGEPEVST
jgi:hypothetical protein